MSNDQVRPQIEIPRADESEVVTIPEGFLGKISQKFERIDQIVFGIMLAVVLALIAIIVSVVGLFLDQMRFNNVAYKEYSGRVQILDSMHDSNKELLKQNKQNQEIIIEQLNQTLDLLNKN